MPVAHVQRLEVVPVGLHLGTFGDLEAEADERVLQPFPCLGHEVGVAALRSADELGEIESFGVDPRVERLAAERGAAALERRGDRGHRLVDRLTGRLLVVDRCERAEPGLQLGEVALLAGQRGGEFVDLVERRRRRDRAECRVTGGGDVGEHVDGLSDAVSVVERHPPVSPGARKSLQLRLHGSKPYPLDVARPTYRYGAHMRLEEIGEIDGWRCWLCDEPVDPTMSVNDPRGPSVDSRTTERRAKAKGTGKGKGKGTGQERLAHRACNTGKGAVDPVIPWPDDLFVADAAVIISSVDRLSRKGGREAFGRCPDRDDAERAADLDRRPDRPPRTGLDVTARSSRAAASTSSSCGPDTELRSAMRTGVRVRSRGDHHRCP